MMRVDFSFVFMGKINRKINFIPAEHFWACPKKFDTIEIRKIFCFSLNKNKKL